MQISENGKSLKIYWPQMNSKNLEWTHRTEKTSSLTIEPAEHFLKSDSASHTRSANEKNKLKGGYLKESHEIDDSFLDEKFCKDLDSLNGTSNENSLLWWDRKK